MATEASNPSAGGRFGRFVLRHWVPIVLVVLAAIFIMQNRARVPVEILWFSVTSPMWLLLIVIFAVGIVAGLLLSRRRR